MELRHLRYFLATARAGTVSGAATALRVAQPSLSRQLRHLENTLGVALFDRSGGRLRLSRAGHELLPQARVVVAEAERMVEFARFHATGGLARLRVSAPTVTLTEVVAPFVATLGEGDPTVDVIASDDPAPSATTAGGADLVITTRSLPPPAVSVPLAALPVWAQVPPEHPWARAEAVALREVMSATLTMPPRSATARQAFDLACQQQGVTVAEVVEVANGALAQALAAAGRGVAVVSDEPRFGLRPLRISMDGRDLRIRLRTGWDSRHPAATRLADLAGRLGEFVRTRYGAPPE